HRVKPKRVWAPGAPGSAGRPTGGALGTHILATYDETLDSHKMSQHRLLGLPGVSRLDRRQDVPVVAVGQAGPARMRPRLLSTLGQKIHEGRDDPCDGAVVRRVGEGGVERRILRESGTAGGDLGPLLVEDPRHVGDLLGAGPPGRKPRDGRLQQTARLVE